MGYKQKIWWIGLHIAVPLIMGAVIYYLISPEVIFIKMFSTHGRIPTPLKLNQSHVIYRFIRNYFLDMLWAYALMNTLIFLIGKSSSAIKISDSMAIIFTVILEGLQLTSFVSGTFDVWDIVVEIIGELFAVWMNNKRKGGFL